MEFKNLLKKEIIKQRKIISVSFIVSMIISGFFWYLYIHLLMFHERDNLFGIAMFLSMVVMTVMSTCTILLGKILTSSITIEENFVNQTKDINSIRYFLRIKKRLKKKFELPISYTNLSQDMQKEILTKLSKKELRLFDDIDQIYTNPTFKEVLAEKYPIDLQKKVLTKLNSVNYLRLLKDAPKTKVNDFLEDRVKKTIA